MKKRFLGCMLMLAVMLGALSGGISAKTNGFLDVAESDWYYDAVCFATDNGLMEGTGRGFEPDAPVSRAMLWTLLSRLDGQHAKRIFAPDWYAAAQLWVVQSGISDGTDPDGTITREQLAAMLYRFAQRKGLIRAASGAGLDAFIDASAVSEYAREAMQWAAENGLLMGMGGRLCPQGSATRAQAAQIIYRMCEEWGLMEKRDAAILAAVMQQHTHAWQGPSSNHDGTHTFTCACGAVRTETCSPVEAGNDWQCSACGFVLPESETIKSGEQLSGAIEQGKSRLFLVEDIALEATLGIRQDTVIYGGGHTLTFEDPERIAQRTMFQVPAGKKLNLHDLTLDGEGKGEARTGDALIKNSKGQLYAENCVFENYVGRQMIHSSWYPEKGTVTLVNTIIRNNRLSSDEKSWQYDNTAAATLLWLSGGETFELTNVTITDNVVTVSAEAAGTVGNGYLIFVKDGATLVADGLTMQNNTARALFSTYGCDHSHHQFKSGRIENNAGCLDVYSDLTIGADMTIDLGADTLWFTNSSGVRTLTNNGTIVGKISKHDWAKTDCSYAGTGTHTGERIGFR